MTSKKKPQPQQPAAPAEIPARRRRGAPIPPNIQAKLDRVGQEFAEWLCRAGAQLDAMDAERDAMTLDELVAQQADAVAWQKGPPWKKEADALVKQCAKLPPEKRKKRLKALATAWLDHAPEDRPQWLRELEAVAMQAALQDWVRRNAPGRKSKISDDDLSRLCRAYSTKYPFWTKTGIEKAVSADPLSRGVSAERVRVRMKRAGVKYGAKKPTSTQGALYGGPPRNRPLSSSS